MNIKNLSFLTWMALIGLGLAAAFGMLEISSPGFKFAVVLLLVIGLGTVLGLMGRGALKEQVLADHELRILKLENLAQPPSGPRLPNYPLTPTGGDRNPFPPPKSKDTAV